MTSTSTGTQDLDFGRIFIEREPAVRILVQRSRDPRGAVLIGLLEAFLKHVDLDAVENAEGLFVIGPRGHSSPEARELTRDSGGLTPRSPAPPCR